MTKQEIIEKHWPKPRECNVPNIPAMKDAISKMMDEWAGYIIQGTTSITHTYEIPERIVDELIKDKKVDQ